MSDARAIRLHGATVRGTPKRIYHSGPEAAKLLFKLSEQALTKPKRSVQAVSVDSSVDTDVSSISDDNRSTSPATVSPKKHVIFDDSPDQLFYTFENAQESRILVEYARREQRKQQHGDALTPEEHDHMTQDLHNPDPATHSYTDLNSLHPRKRPNYDKKLEDAPKSSRYPNGYPKGKQARSKRAQESHESPNSNIRRRRTL